MKSHVSFLMNGVCFWFVEGSKTSAWHLPAVQMVYQCRAAFWAEGKPHFDCEVQRSSADFQVKPSRVRSSTGHRSGHRSGVADSPWRISKISPASQRSCLVGLWPQFEGEVGVYMILYIYMIILYIYDYIIYIWYIYIYMIISYIYDYIIYIWLLYYIYIWLYVYYYYIYNYYIHTSQYVCIHNYRHVDCKCCRLVPGLIAATYERRSHCRKWCPPGTVWGLKLRFVCRMAWV